MVRSASLFARGAIKLTSGKATPQATRNAAPQRVRKPSLMPVLIVVIIPDISNDMMPDM